MAYPHGAYLAPSDFGDAFQAAWDAAESRFLKVERRQSYNQADDKSFAAFLRGNTEQAVKLVVEELLGQREMYDRARARGVELVRLRLIEEPLSDYLRLYEFPSYRTSAELGESIFVAPVSDAADLLPDCIIFDEEAMFVNTYDGLDRLGGCVLISDKNDIREHIALAEAYLLSATPLEEFAIARGLWTP